MHKFKLSVFIVFLIINNNYAQLQHSFTNIAHDSTDDFISCIDISSQGIIFAASSSGLYAYTFIDSVFTNIASIDGTDYGNSYVDDIAVGLDSIIYLASSYNGLHAYSFDGTQFNHKAYIKNYNYFKAMDIGEEGLVFLICKDSLFAYEYMDTTFRNTVNINTTSRINDIYLNPDGTIFLASDSGLFSYTYHGDSILPRASFKTSGIPQSVTSTNDGKVLLATTIAQHEFGTDILNLYSFNYNESTFSLNTQFIDTIECSYNIKIRSPYINVVFLTGSTALPNCGHSPSHDVSLSLGLFAYTFDTNLITKTAHEFDRDIGLDLILNQESIIIINGANHGNGGTFNRLTAYTYSGITSIETELLLNPKLFKLTQNYPNPFNPKTEIRYQLPLICEVKLSIYNLLGQKVATLVSEKQVVGDYTVEWDASGYASGIYIYRLETDKGFVQSRKLILLK